MTVDVEAMAVARSGRSASAEQELADLERLWYDLALPGHRVELVNGELVVSPTADRWHSGVVYNLTDALIGATRRHGWVVHTNLAVYIPATGERLVPDLMVAPRDAPGHSDCELVGHGVLLAAEVVSPSSRLRDREEKPRAYATGMVPLYLLVDRLADPATVTLYREPAGDSYPVGGSYKVVERAGSGQRLHLPRPFDLQLDVGKLLGA